MCPYNVNGRTSLRKTFWFRQPITGEEEVSFLASFKDKSTQYEDKWLIDVFKNCQAAREN